MKRVFKWLAIALASVVLVIAALVAHTIYFKPLSLDWFYARVRGIRHRQPGDAVVDAHPARLGGLLQRQAG
jgi:hypothetical protein